MEEEDAIRTDAAMAVAEGLDACRGEGAGWCRQHDEVVAEGVVFGEGEGHGGLVRGSCRGGQGLWQGGR